MGDGGLDDWRDQPAVVTLVLTAVVLVVYVAASNVVLGEVDPVQTVVFVVVFAAISYWLRRRST